MERDAGAAGHRRAGRGGGFRRVDVPTAAPPARATLREVAVRAGVHPATASRALNEETRALVAAATAARILEAARELGYRPNHLARGLKTRRSATIGVIVPDLTNPLFPPIVRGIEDFLGARDYVALVANTDNDEEREARVFDEMRGRHVDGIIVATARRRHPALTEAIASGMPVVLVNRVLEEHAVSSVSVDDEAGMRMALDHLLALGHRRIAHVAGPQDLSTTRGRYAGYVEGMRAAGLSIDPALVVHAQTLSEEEGYRCAEELMSGGQSFTAVLAGNDMLALGALRSWHERKLVCPDAFSLVGFNDMPFMDRVAPPLTTVRIPHYEFGFEAARLLCGHIQGNETAPYVLRLTPELVVRESTAPVAAAPVRPISARRASAG